MSQNITEANPLLSTTGAIAFDQITSAHVVPAIGSLIYEAQDAIDAIGSDSRPGTFDSVLGEMERATTQLEDAMGWVDHLEGLTDDPEFRAAYNDVQPRVAAFYSSIPLNQALWVALCEFADTTEARDLAPVERRLLDKTVSDFRRAGADLGAEDKKKLALMDVDLAKETNTFTQNVVDSSDAYELLIVDESRLDGLPDSDRAAARASAESKGMNGWRFTLQGPSFVGAITYLEDRAIRETLYRAYNQRAAFAPFDNSERLHRILSLRRQKAKLLGYEDVSDLYLENRMVRSGGAAAAFLSDLKSKSEPASLEEHAELALFVSETEGVSEPLSAWDISYYAERQRKARYAVDEEVLRPYFGLDSVLRGLFGIFNRLYGVVITPLEAHPVWHQDVTTYTIHDAEGLQLGVFYLDLFPRTGKRGGAWMRPLRTGHWQAGEPHVGVVCCNLSPPSNGRPSLLRHREVETVFHEFGHLMHHLLTTVTIRSLAGTNVAWDFVELPSQIMENWCWERSSLDLFARHYETGDAMPDELFGKLQAARNFRSGSAMMRQLCFGTVDLALHREYDPAIETSVIEYAHRIAAGFQVTPLPSDYAMIASFQHLFSGPVAYASGYYSYKWAEVLEADAFSRFKNEGLFSTEVGSEFRELLLSQGNSREPMDLFIAFMGRQPDPSALLQRAGLA
jgi:oligopeptidase A